jgi:hypothetical protein
MAGSSNAKTRFALKPGHDDNACGRVTATVHSPSTALVMMLRWISLEPP